MEGAWLDISTQDASDFYSHITVKKNPKTMEWVSARDGCLIRRFRFLIPITQFGANILHPIIHFISEHREWRGLWVGTVSVLGFSSWHHVMDGSDSIVRKHTYISQWLPDWSFSLFAGKPQHLFKMTQLKADIELLLQYHRVLLRMHKHSNRLRVHIWSRLQDQGV